MRETRPADAVRPAERFVDVAEGIDARARGSRLPAWEGGGCCRGRGGGRRGGDVDG